MNHRYRKTAVALFAVIICGILASGCFAGADADYGLPDQPGQLPDQKGGDGVRYEDIEFGFKFSLPESWAGYLTELDEWEGVPSAEGTGNGTEGNNEGDSEGEAENDPGRPVELRGPIIIIRHPEWTEEKQRQDIPIIVFTLNQWEDLTAGKYNVGAAPVGPTELGRNDSFVFALPARYNYALLEGFEEVERILEGDPLEVLDE